MTTAILEHVNFTVENSEQTARRLCDLFGWTIRWSGPSLHGGHSVHVGTRKHYLAIYSEPTEDRRIRDNNTQLNHIGIVVSDLDAIERRILAAGYKTEFHSDYEPGRRFYFTDEDNVEYEVVSYAKPRNSVISSVMTSMGSWTHYASWFK